MGSPSPPSNPYTYGPAANNLDWSTLQSLSGIAGQGQNFTNNITNNPYAGGYQSAAGNAAGSFGSLGRNATGASGALYGAGNAVLQAGYDPQNALYARTQQQTQDQTLAGLAATGVGATPYGASVLGQTNTNFNIDWQNNELQRMIAAGTAAQGDFTQGAQQGQIGAGATLESGALPYNTANTINQTDLAALGSLQSLYAPVQSGAANYLSGYNSAQQQSWQDAEQQNQAMWQGIGSIAGLGLSGGPSGLFGWGGLGSLLAVA